MIILFGIGVCWTLKSVSVSGEELPRRSWERGNLASASFLVLNPYPAPNSSICVSWSSRRMQAASTASSAITCSRQTFKVICKSMLDVMATSIARKASNLFMRFSVCCNRSARWIAFAAILLAAQKIRISNSVKHSFRPISKVPKAFFLGAQRHY